MEGTLWNRCVTQLERNLTAQQFNTWIRPLQAVERSDELVLLAPNNFVRDWVNENFRADIEDIVHAFQGCGGYDVSIRIGSKSGSSNSAETMPRNCDVSKPKPEPATSRLRGQFTFDNFVEGKSNHFARAAAMQVADNPGATMNNPLLIYGGVGLGKTHLIHAIGNGIAAAKPGAKVVYIHSERFVHEMVRALQRNGIDEFKRYYRSLDALLIDDIQFFAGKDRSQEEFFHTFNALLEANQQVIISCDRYPKEVEGLESRLTSRFGWGLTVAIEPPELETRVAILMRKAQEMGVLIDDDVAFFIGQRIRSNVRELEGALRRVAAEAQFSGQTIDIEFAKRSLRDLVSVHERRVSLDNIQKIVAQRYNLRVSDLLSRKRTKSIAEPRQIAMALAKELTAHSFPEIGEAFGGRDHTTVIHACKKITERRQLNAHTQEEFDTLVRLLSS